MTDWVRLWHDMPTDPKWRVIARKSGQPLPCVLAVFTMMLTNASANGEHRGQLLAWDHEDAGAALDMDAADVEAIYDAMQGKVLDGDTLTGWERRQPKREDSGVAARVAKHRATKAAEVKRDVTQGNAPETDAETETDTNPDKSGVGKARGRADKPKFELPDWVPPEPWAAFVEMRRAMPKVPFTVTAAKGIISDLDKLRASGEDPGLVLLRAVKRGDRGVFAASDGSTRATRQATSTEWTPERRAEYLAKQDAPRGTGPPKPIGSLVANLVSQVQQ